MDNLENNPITIVEYEKWLENKQINPRTKRRIKENSKIYNCYKKVNYQELLLLSTIDNKDPISLNELWTMDNDIKKIAYDNLDNLVFYKDTYNIIRCFEKESIEYMLGYNIKNHPITNELLPEHIFLNITSKKIITEKDKTVQELAFDVFQLFANLSFFIDCNLFLNLSKENLIKLYHEIKDFYKQNFTIEQQNVIGNTIFKMDENILKDNELEYIQKYILADMKKLLQVDIEEYKYMINYILIGGLSLVIKEIKDTYPDFSFSFT